MVENTRYEPTSLMLMVRFLISSKAIETGIIDRVAAICKKNQGSLTLKQLRFFYQSLDILYKFVLLPGTAQ